MENWGNSQKRCDPYTPLQARLSPPSLLVPLTHIPEVGAGLVGDTAIAERTPFLYHQVSSCTTSMPELDVDHRGAFLVVRPVRERYLLCGLS